MFRETQTLEAYELHSVIQFLNARNMSATHRQIAEVCGEHTMYDQRDRDGCEPKLYRLLVRRWQFVETVCKW